MPAPIRSRSGSDRARSAPPASLPVSACRKLTAIMDAVEEARKPTRPVIADGGIKYSGDLAKAIAPAATASYRLIACRYRRNAGRGLSLSRPLLQNLSRHGLRHRHGAWLRRRYFQQEIKDTLKGWCRKAFEGQVPYKGPVANVVHQLMGGCAPQWAMSAPLRSPIFTTRPVRAYLLGRPAREPRPRRHHHAREPELSQPDLALPWQARHPTRSQKYAPRPQPIAARHGCGRLSV